MQELWSAVDRYIVDALHEPDAALDAAIADSSASGLPPIAVTPATGKFLWTLARVANARRILEIGTLGGFSAIWLARALPADGRLVTLELEPRHAAVARRSVDRAGVGDRVEIRVGPALASLEGLHRTAAEPFDLVFIDADKPNNPHYLGWALRLTRPGSVIVVDNVVRDGEVIDAASPDPRVQGVRRMHELIAATPSLTATTLQTVGSKGYDGFTIAIVLPSAM